MSFPGSADGEESTCSAGDLGLIPGLGRSPRGRHEDPFQCSCLESQWAEDPGESHSMGSQRVGRDWVTKHSTVDLIALFSQGVSYFFLHHLYRNNVLSCSFFQQFPLHSPELISSCWRGPSWMLCFSHHWAQGRKRREAGGGKLYLCSFSEGCLTLWLSEDISSMWDSSSVFFSFIIIIIIA